MFYPEIEKKQLSVRTKIEAGRSISYKIACASSEDSDQTAHPRVCSVLSVPGCRSAMQRLQADLNFHWVHMQSFPLVLGA